jgi:hypothetical protein
MSIESKLKYEIERELDELDGLTVGSKEHSDAVDNLVKLLDRAIDMDRNDTDEVHKSETRAAEERAREADELNKAEDRKAEEKHRMIGYIINGLGIGVPALITIWGTVLSLKFEEKGTITSPAGRAFFGRIFGKK